MKTYSNGGEKRTNESILSNLEQRFIKFMLPRFPKYITPDALTFISFISGVFIFLGYYAAKNNKYFLFLVSFFILLHWFSDSHDGGLANFRKQSRPKYGFYIDHILDLTTFIFIFLGFAVYGLEPWAIALLATGYAVLFFHSIVLCKITNHLQLSFNKFSPTESRVILVFINILLFFNFKNLVETLFYISAILLIIYSAYIITETARKLDKEDRKKIEAKRNPRKTNLK